MTAPVNSDGCCLVLLGPIVNVPQMSLKNTFLPFCYAIFFYSGEVVPPSTLTQSKYNLPQANITTK